VMRAHQERSGPEMVETSDTPKLEKWRSFKKGATASKGVLSSLTQNMSNINGLRNYASTITMPDCLDEFQNNRHYSVAIDYSRCVLCSV
jgi:hypothetical protein